VNGVARASFAPRFISLCHCRADSRKGRIQRVKHCEIADNLSKADWSWGCVSSVVAAKKEGNELRGARNYTGT